MRFGSVSINPVTYTEDCELVQSMGQSIAAEYMIKIFMVKIDLHNKSITVSWMNNQLNMQAYTGHMSIWYVH